MYEFEPGAVLTIRRTDHGSVLQNLAHDLRTLQLRIPEIDLVFAGPTIDALFAGTECSDRTPVWIFTANRTDAATVRDALQAEGIDPERFRIAAADRAYIQGSAQRRATDLGAQYLFENSESIVITGHDRGERVGTPRIHVARGLLAAAHHLGISADADRQLHRYFRRNIDIDKIAARRDQAFLAAITRLSAMDTNQVERDVAAIAPSALQYVYEQLRAALTIRELNAIAADLPQDPAVHQVLVDAWRVARDAEAGINERFALELARRPGAGYHLRHLTGLDTPADEWITQIRQEIGTGERTAAFSTSMERLWNVMQDAMRPNRNTAEVHDLGAYRTARNERTGDNSMER